MSSAKFDFTGAHIGRQINIGGDAVFDQRGQTVRGSQTNVGRGFRQDAQPDTQEGDERYSFELWWARMTSPTSDVKELAWLAWQGRAELDG